MVKTDPEGLTVEDFVGGAVKKSPKGAVLSAAIPVFTNTYYVPTLGTFEFMSGNVIEAYARYVG